MKFDENVENLLKKYPLNEDLGNIFGTLGNFVNKHVKEILAPMTDPFKGLVRKTDLSQGDGILEEVRKSLIKTPEVFNKQIYFLNKGKSVYFDKDKKPLPASYKQLTGQEELKVFTDKEKLDYYNRPVVDKTGKPVFKDKDVKAIIKEVIQYVNLNSYNLVDKNKSLLLQKIQEIFEKRKEKQKEYGEEKDPLKSDMSPERVYKRLLYLTKREIFVTKAKDLDEKTEWLYILAKPNDKFDYAGTLPKAEKEEKSEPKPPTPKPTPTPTAPKPTPTPTSTPTPTRAPRTPAPPTRVVRPRTP